MCPRHHFSMKVRSVVIIQWSWGCRATNHMSDSSKSIKSGHVQIQERKGVGRGGGAKGRLSGRGEVGEKTGERR